MQEHLRLTLLRLLADDPDYTMNDSLLTDLTYNYGFTPSRDKVRTELSWLKEQGLITTDGDPKITIAKLTERGSDVARGRVTVPGIKRPSPGR
ncbi:MAG: ArsR family transcriptional regulator [Desulfobacteraceae bacterium]|nr:ArsR family transcriptional regulator [Desulfobacteraceae bacterium]